EFYDSALLAPLFIVMSFSFGLAVFLLVLMAACRGSGRALGAALLERLGRLLGVFVAAVLYVVAVYHLTNLYIARQHEIERFVLLEGGVYTALFWVGQVLVGGIVPLVLLFTPAFRRSGQAVAAAAVCVILGGLAQIYVLIIGGQAFPQLMFPGKEVTSSFFDGVVAAYAPSLPEVALGVGGVALALALTVVALRALPFLPRSLADGEAEPTSA
ncbi:MAG: NrfD/PsrC family molybdoenzyme membrane anchor subunit, partial [Burkholderiales bacterium]|nr:NrfD/PsrC family molybdoenzyme membrane anchor subunit [Burkholderiales bacterium]